MTTWGKQDYVFCLPGNPSSGRQEIFTFSAMNEMGSKGVNLAVRQDSGNNIYMVRNSCLSTKGKRADQKPFQGTENVAYQKVIWVDSDNFVLGKDVKKLIDYDVDIVAAWYRITLAEGDVGYSITSCGYENFGYASPDAQRLLVQPLKFYESKPILEKDILSITRDGKGLIPVDYSGLGLMVVKKRVFEALEYPWFMSWVFEWEEDGVKMRKLVTDDEGFCIRARQAGFKILVDPQMQICHEKRMVI